MVQKIIEFLFIALLVLLEPSKKSDAFQVKHIRGGKLPGIGKKPSIANPVFFLSQPEENEVVSGEQHSVNVDNSQGGFDGEGLMGYLAPYAFAVVASLGVTYAFVMFLLNDSM